MMPRILVQLYLHLAGTMVNFYPTYNMKYFNTSLLALNMQHTYEHRYATVEKPTVIQATN